MFIKAKKRSFWEDPTLINPSSTVCLIYFARLCGGGGCTEEPLTLIIIAAAWLAVLEAITALVTFSKTFTTRIMLISKGIAINVIEFLLCAKTDEVLSGILYNSIVQYCIYKYSTVANIFINMGLLYKILLYITTARDISNVINIYTKP